MKWLFDTMTRKYSFSRGNHEPKKIKENIWGVFFFLIIVLNVICLNKVNGITNETNGCANLKRSTKT